MGQFGRRTVELTGNASGFNSVEVFPSGISGRLLGVDIRLDTTDNNASAILPFAVCNQDNLQITPPQDNIVFDATSVSLTASATVADLTTMFDNPSVYYDGLRVGGNVTATGAYKIFITVQYEFRDR